jgi:CO/xanthine dehydrogenase Mo-binding subunit
MSAAVRPDAVDKVHGAVEFGVDVERPGMLWAVLVLAPVPRARIRAVDLAPARERPGVVAIGAADVPRLLDGRAGDTERPIFPEREVAYPAQPLAAIAAPTLEEAREAARLVRLELEPLPAITDLESAVPDWPDPSDPPANAIGHVRARRGDVDAELRGAELVVRETYRTSGLVQMPIEPHACVAEVVDGQWAVWTTTQTPFGTREDTASILGIPEKELVVHGTWVGGGFGGKGAALLEPYGLLLAKASGRPVRLALGYRDEFLLSRSTLPMVIRFETGVRAGRIVARKVRLLLDAGASLPGRDFSTGFSIGFLLGPYATPSFEVEGYALRTNKPAFGPHRAPLAPQCAFALESHIEEVARQSGVDPIEFRRTHLWKEGDRTVLGQEVGPFGIGVALEKAATTAQKWRSERRPGHGIGVAVGFWSTAVGAGGEARVVLGPKELSIVQGEREIGSGSVLVGLAAVAERRTGLPRERIRVVHRDTASAPFDSGVFGSRTVGALGTAVVKAIDEVYAELGRRLGGHDGVRLEVAGGELAVRANGTVRPIRDLLTSHDAADGGIVGAGKHYPAGGAIDESLVVDGSFYPYSDFTGAAHVAEVSVDEETGAVRLERYAAFQDVGTVIDRPSAQAQVEGGVVMGLGAALTEETIWGADGRLSNAGLLDYRIPTLGEVPPIEVTFVEGFGGAGPFGAKGLGEPPIIPVPGAVASAVRDACGAHLTELPLSAERVARALKRDRTSPSPDDARAR